MSFDSETSREMNLLNTPFCEWNRDYKNITNDNQFATNCNTSNSIVILENILIKPGNTSCALSSTNSKLTDISQNKSKIIDSVDNKVVDFDEVIPTVSEEFNSTYVPKTTDMSTIHPYQMDIRSEPIPLVNVNVEYQNENPNSIVIKMDSVYESKERKHKCTNCIAAFKFREQLRRHKKCHDPVHMNNNISKEKRKFICSICEKVFSKNCYLNSHNDRVHGIHLECVKGCGKKFTRKQVQLSHQLSCKAKK